MYEQTLTVNGFSKGAAMTGFRLGYVAGPVGAIKAMAKVQGNNTSCPSSVAQHAGVAAVAHAHGDFALGCVENFRKKRDYVVARLRAMPGVECPVPQVHKYIYIYIFVFFTCTATSRWDAWRTSARSATTSWEGCVPSPASSAQFHRYREIYMQRCIYRNRYVNIYVFILYIYIYIYIYIYVCMYVYIYIYIYIYDYVVARLRAMPGVECPVPQVDIYIYIYAYIYIYVNIYIYLYTTVWSRGYARCPALNAQYRRYV